MDDGVHCTSSFGHGDKVVPLPAGTLLENTLLFGHVVEAFREYRAKEKELEEARALLQGGDDEMKEGSPPGTGLMP